MHFLRSVDNVQTAGNDSMFYVHLTVQHLASFFVFILILFPACFFDLSFFSIIFGLCFVYLAEVQVKIYVNTLPIMVVSKGLFDLIFSLHSAVYFASFDYEFYVLTHVSCTVCFGH